MNELLTWTLAAVAVAVMLLLLWLGRRRQHRVRADAQHREAEQLMVERAEHAARAQRVSAEMAARREADAQALREIEAAVAQRLALQRAEEENLEAERARAEREEASRYEAQAAREAAAAAEARRQAEARAEAERLAREQAEREAAEAERLAAEQRRIEAERAAAARAMRELRADETLVLVADDSKIVRVKISRLLSAQGYRVALAESGEQALELLAAERPHVLITDVEMPGIDGFELTRQVRAAAATAGLPVLMITSSDDKQEQAQAAGVTQLLGKPYSEAALIAAIERARLAVRVPG